MYDMASDDLGIRIRDDLGIRIRRARERKGWTQEHLASALPPRPDGSRTGVRSIGRWERGEAIPRNAIGALEMVLGTDLTGNGRADVYTDPDEARIWSWTVFTTDERRAMIDGLRAARGKRATA